MGCGGSKSKEAAPKPATGESASGAVKARKTAAPVADKGNPNIAVLGKILEAWAGGKFNDDSKTETIKKFFHEDVVVDGSGGAFAGLADLKKYTGHAEVVEYFAYLGKMDYGTPESPPEFVFAPGPSPEILYMKWKCDTTVKGGKGPVHDTGLILWTFADGKVKMLTFMYSDPTVLAALFAGEAVPIPEPFKAPTFEPHPDPLPVYQTIFDGWATGQMANPETKGAFFAKHMSENLLFDMTGPHEKFKKYEGIAGIDTWVNGVVGADWDMSNIVGGAAAGPQPGTVIARISCDLTVKETGKSLKGVDFYFEWGIDKSGKAVYVKSYWKDAASIAALYEA